MHRYSVAIKRIEEPGGSPLKWTSCQLDRLKSDLNNLMMLAVNNAYDFRGRSVYLHPNLVRPSATRPASFTDPRLILACVDYFLDMGARRVEIGEKPGFGYPSRAAFREAGLTHHLEQRGVTIHYLDEEEWITRDNPSGRLYRKIHAARSVLDADYLVNLPKMKTHMLTMVSLCVKNLLGMIHDNDRQIYHRNDIADKIVDLLFIRPPDMNIIDGLWPMEGQAPFNGDAIPGFNVLVAGHDAPAVDAAACLIMGISPIEVPHVQLACQRHLSEWIGPDSLHFTGDPLVDVQRAFKRPVLSSMAQFQGVECIECGVCSGCLSAIRHSLDWLRAEGILDSVPEVTIVSGRPMPNRQTLETWNGRLILFGNCAAEFQFFDTERRQNFIWIPGCAPHVLDLANRLKMLISGIHSE
ncbi:DUF362 domain-containing protein [bacterium]|nr:DUF362 domain-containing protein [candidate division CSSED10-310 bacterium]